MDRTELTAASLEKFFSGGCVFLRANKAIVDALNVFPVPDGDTGTNMTLTMNSAVKDLAGIDSAARIAEALSMGALMGARGNSGVILSQIFRGFAQGVGDKEKLSSLDFAFALQKGVELAYRSVMRPVEGTILTVSKAVAEEAVRQSKQQDDVIEMLALALQNGQTALENTPDQLPALKQAGVVDAGGKGFLMVLEGGLRALKGEMVDVPCAEIAKAPVAKRDYRDSAEIKYQYCTEFILKGQGLSTEEISEVFQDKGDSLLVVGTENLVKIHVHTNNPGLILDHAVKLGTLHDIKIDNMQEQHRSHLLEISEEEAVCGVVAVAAGDGMVKIFESLGNVKVINGGQTMNPSAGDLLKAMESIPAKEIIILPNNSNIVLTAEQAASLAQKTVCVVPTKSPAQGVGAMMAFDQEENAENNLEKMTAAFAHIKTGEVTYAVRNSTYDGMEIKENDILGLWDGTIKVIGREVNPVALDLMDKMVDEADELTTIFYGSHVSKDEAEALAEQIVEVYPEMEVELQYGGQPLYYYLISVE